LVLGGPLRGKVSIVFIVSVLQHGHSSGFLAQVIRGEAHPYDPKWLDYLAKRKGKSIQSFFWVLLPGGYHTAFQELEPYESKGSKPVPFYGMRFLGDWGGVTRLGYPTKRHNVQTRILFNFDTS
jgi:hypothetical protein